MKLKCRRCLKDYEVKSNVDLMTDWHILLGFDPQCAKIIESETFNLSDMNDEDKNYKAPLFNKRFEAKEFLVAALRENNEKIGLPADGRTSSERDIAKKIIAYINAVYNSYLALGNPRNFLYLESLSSVAIDMAITGFLNRMGTSDQTIDRLVDLSLKHIENTSKEYLSTALELRKKSHPGAKEGAVAAIDLHLPWRKGDATKNPSSFCFDLLNAETMGAYLFMQAGLSKVEPWEILWANEMQFSIAADLATNDLTFLVGETRETYFYKDFGLVQWEIREGGRAFFFDRGINYPFNFGDYEEIRTFFMKLNAERTFESFLAQSALKVDRSESIQAVYSEALSQIALSKRDGEIFNEAYISYRNALRGPGKTTLKKALMVEYASPPIKEEKRSPREVIHLAKSLSEDIKENKASEWGLHSVGLLALSPIIQESIRLNTSNGAILVVENGNVLLKFYKDDSLEGLRNGRSASQILKKYAESRGVMFGTREFERFAEDKRIFAFVPSSVLDNESHNAEEKSYGVDETGVFLYQFAYNEINEQLASERGIDLDSLIQDGGVRRGMTITRGVNFSGNGCLELTNIIPPDNLKSNTESDDVVYEYAKERGGSFFWSASMQNFMVNGDLNKFFPAPSLDEVFLLKDYVKEEPTLLQVIGLAISQTKGN